MGLFFKVIICLMLWLPFFSMAGASDSLIELTPLEKDWIKEHPQIIVANETDWPPFDYVENGRPAGYSIDIVRLIEKKTGLTVRFVNGFTWQELMQRFKAGKIDLMPAIFSNRERQNYILFTKSYHAQPSVIVAHKDSDDIVNIDTLAGKRIVGVKGFSFTASIKKNIPNSHIILVDNILEGLKAVSLGKADAFIESIGTVSYALEKNYIPNVKIISRVNNTAFNNPPIHMGVAKNQFVLHSIIGKALASITRDEKRILAARWFTSNVSVQEKKRKKIS